MGKGVVIASLGPGQNLGIGRELAAAAGVVSRCRFAKLDRTVLFLDSWNQARGLPASAFETWYVACASFEEG